MNQIVKDLQDVDVQVLATDSGGLPQPRTIDEVVKVATLMSQAGPAVPKHLREQPGACFAVWLQASRWEMDPFAVARKTYFVNENIAFEAQMVAAVVNTRAGLKRRPTYVYDGDGDLLTCKVSGEFEDGVVQVYESPPVGAISPKNSPLWKTDPRQQLGYFSIARWARRFCPEVILGIYMPEEAAAFGPDKAKDITPSEPAFVSRLAAAKAAGDPADFDGFDPKHVEREIAGDTEETSDPNTGEIIEAGDTEPDQRLVAFNAGREARSIGKPLINVPEPYSADQIQSDAWQDGWREEAKLIDSRADAG